MATETIFSLPLPNNSADHHYYHVWNTQNPKAWVHIMHGMSEHGGRYAEVAEFLNTQGITVTADDHRGHGLTGSHANSLFHLADNDGWNQLIEDQWHLIRHFGKNLQVPLIILGHSMGSYMALDLCQRYGNRFNSDFPLDLAGLALSGSGYRHPFISGIGQYIAQLERLRLGGKTSSQLLEYLSFGQFKRPFKPIRTDHDWISSDPIAVDNYVQDPFCGGAISTQSWCDFTAGLGEIFARKQLKKLNSDLPIYLFSGSDDPVGNQGAGVKKLKQILLQNGVSDVQLRLYQNGRHEMLKEVQRDAVYSDLLRWLQRIIRDL